MDIEELVDRVIEEVNRRSEIRENIITKERVFITDKESEADYKDLEKHLIEDGFAVYGYESNEEKYDYILINKLSNRELANLSMGVECGRLETIVIEALFRGVKVYLLEEGIAYRHYKQSVNAALYKLYEDHETKIASYGIRIINRNCLHLNKSNDIMESKPVSMDLSNKKVITEDDLRRNIKGKNVRIMVSKKSIITPLGRDFIKANNVEIEVV